MSLLMVLVLICFALLFFSFRYDTLLTQISSYHSYPRVSLFIPIEII